MIRRSMVNIYFFVEHRDVIIVLKANLYILTSDFVADWTEIEVLREIVKYAVEA